MAKERLGQPINFTLQLRRKKCVHELHKCVHECSDIALTCNLNDANNCRHPQIHLDSRFDHITFVFIGVASPGRHTVTNPSVEKSKHLP